MTTVLDRRNAPKAKPLAEPETHDVHAVDHKAPRIHYAAREKVYPKLAHGNFRKIKWIVMLVTLAIYYGLPWLRWNRGPDLPNQAVLLDLPNNRYFMFFLEIWPQEFYYVTGLLLLAALLLFLFTSIAGRVWCGYTCPQTVWTDLMVTVERFWQGDRNARIRLDKEPWGLIKIFKKGMTHLTWLLIGLATGGAMVFYFADAPTLLRQLLTFTAPTTAYFYLGLFTLTTYLLGGIAREQVCIYMCPWPRIQGAMTDRHTLLVSYKGERGEPRGPMRKAKDGTVDWSARGDCIDCKACVAVCPTGIDIRNGSQLECIQCALCIDACNEIMDKISRPRGLIAYDTVAKQEALAAGSGHEAVRVIRTRTLLYFGVFCIIGLVMLAAWFNRSVLELNAIADRNPPYVGLSDGSIRNGFTIKILNKLHEPRRFALSTHGLDGARLVIAGQDHAQSAPIEVPTDELREVRAYVSVPPTHLPKLSSTSTTFDLVIRDLASGHEVRRAVKFHKP